MGLTDLVVGGGALAIGTAIATGHGDDLLAFGQKALGKLGDLFKGLFGNDHVPDKDPTGTRENEEKIAGEFIDGNKIKTQEELDSIDIYSQYDMEQNIEDAYVNAFDAAAGRDINAAQALASGIPILGRLFENENQHDAKEISMMLASRCGIVALEGDAKLNMTDSANRIYDKAVNALENFSEDGDKDEAMKELSAVLGMGMDDSESSAEFAVSAERAIMGNDTFAVTYDYLNAHGDEVVVSGKHMAEGLAEDLINKCGTPHIEGKTDEEAKQEVVDSIYKSIHECNYYDPVELSMHMSNNLIANDITFENQTLAIEKFKNDRANGKFEQTDIGDKQVSGSFAEDMATASKGEQPTSVEQATAGAKDKNKETQSTDKVKGVDEIEK